jgi:hypothetical protein
MAASPPNALNMGRLVLIRSSSAPLDAMPDESLAATARL